MFFIDPLQFLFHITAFLCRKWSKPTKSRKYVHQRRNILIVFPFMFNFHTFHVLWIYLILFLDSFHTYGSGFSFVNIEFPKPFVAGYTCLLPKPAYPLWALWWIILYPADLHFLNVFSTTLLVSTRSRTCEMVKSKFVQYMLVHFLTYIKSVRKKNLSCSYTKIRQKHCGNSSIFPIVCPYNSHGGIVYVHVTIHY